MKKCAYGILNTKDFQKDEVFANDRFTVTDKTEVLKIYKTCVMIIMP